MIIFLIRDRDKCQRSDHRLIFIFLLKDRELFFFSFKSTNFAQNLNIFELYLFEIIQILLYFIKLGNYSYS